MKVKCWECDGLGRIRIERTDPALHIFTMGISWIMEKLIESDPYDDRFWQDCHICDGYGCQVQD